MFGFLKKTSNSVSPKVSIYPALDAIWFFFPGTYFYSIDFFLPIHESVLKEAICVVIPYVVPEVLLGEQQFIQAADIYGYGIIMAEISTGQRPFDGQKFNIELAVKFVKDRDPSLHLELLNAILNWLRNAWTLIQKNDLMLMIFGKQ
ncbi:hypothetical protein C2G38_2323685 [Gigaspora rosea]|uniref:Protein kinase domain-containing protein n=1 Tax=Gigaspora rosea TaxID=44941 RepID=A0A397W1A2_9GLOM|nr:hypothetical protein C2G38_2323685 [Gigaspora rosea]